MRVISGRFKGLKLFEPNDKTIRPTMDRVKQSLFDVLYPILQGAEVLDLFAGSGSLGIEALSRGARSCIFVDKSDSAIELIKKNLAVCKTGAEILRLDYKDAVKRFSVLGREFDIILLDPPYEKDECVEILKLVLQEKILKDGGKIVFETSAKNLEKEIENKLGFSARVLSYGDKRVYIIG